MKKKIMFLLILITLVVIGIKIYKTNSKQKFDGNWYIEVTNDYINVRDNHSQYSKLLGKIKKGEKYLVRDIYSDGAYIWYKIDKGWISNPKSSNSYLKDYNDPNDLYPPTLKFNEEIYYTESIDTITYYHLECWDDKGYALSYIVYIDNHDKNIGTQYWIKYTITDTAGRNVSKTQKIVFAHNPDKELPDINEK